MAQKPSQTSSECQDCIRNAKRIKSLERKVAKMSRPPDERQSKQIYFNEKDVAKRLGLSVKTLQNWRTKGIGPRWIKIGRSVRYRLRDIIAFQKSLTGGGGSF